MTVFFKNIEGKEYRRFNANLTYISQSQDDNIVIDFFEEHVDTIAMLNEGDQTPVEEENIYVIREQKASIIMTPNEAIYMAHRILDRFSPENDEELMRNEKEGE